MAIYYDKYDIVFQEIPDEVTLAFTIKGCQNNCKGCHSPHLREDFGKELTFDILTKLLLEYKDTITNVLFLGEGNDKKSLRQLMEWCRAFTKVSLYSGRDYIDPYYLEWLDYYKVGSYQHELGGLNSLTTNQKLFKIWCEDITHKLRK